MKTDLKNRVALITGGGSGIGQAIAAALAKEGVRLALAGRTLSKLEKTALLLPDAQILLITGDLTDPEFPAQCIRETLAEYGRLDILVNNAGLAQSEPFEDISLDEYERLMNTNVRAPFLLCQNALPALRKSDCASIINIASVTAHKGYPLQSIYSASKHALLGMTKALAREVQKDGIRVHVLSPGGVFTDMVRVSRPDLSPEGMIMPEDVAEAALFLLTHRSNAVIDEIELHRAGKEPFL